MGRRKKLLLGKYQISDRPAQQESPGIEVKLGWDIISRESVTVKAFDLAKFDNQEGVRELIRFEMNTLWRLDHPNVVRLVDVFKSPTRSKTFVVVEAVSGGGDLFETIAAKGRLEDDLARHYFAQLLDAVEHCHARGVCHRDIKPENVLLDARGNVKLTGFALAGLFDPCLGHHHVENLLHATCGTPDYTAPEVIQGFAYEGAAADVWSLGVTLYAMLAGYLPFEAESLTAVFDKAQAGDFKAAPGMSAEARSLLDCMLEPDPESRYTMRDVRAHPWFAGRAHEYRQGQEHHNIERRHHHQQEENEEEINLRWNERSPRLAGGPAGLRRPALRARDGAVQGARRNGNDGGCGGGVQGWSLDSFVRRQQEAGADELGSTDGQKEQDSYLEKNNTSRDGREESYTAESTLSGGREVSCSSITPSSVHLEGDSPFHDCPSPSECEEEEEEGEGEGARGRVKLNYTDQFAANSSVSMSAAGTSCSSISSRSVAAAVTAAAAAAAAPCLYRSVCGSETTSGTFSITRRLGATRLVLSLWLPNDDEATPAETDGETIPGDEADNIDRLIPAKALQRALESLGCVCRLLLPRKKRTDERKTPLVKVKVKACRAIVADGGGGGAGERVVAEGGEADSIVGVMFSVMLPAEEPAFLDVASAVDGGDSTDCRRSSSGGTTGCSSSSSSGTTGDHRSETTDFLAVLSTGSVVAFNALVDDLLSVPALPSPSCLEGGLPYSKYAEERRERRQSRSLRGRKLGINSSGERKRASGLERRQATATVEIIPAAAGT